MPTGYTADIANGITFRQYALNCARAFGALIMMRDDPSDAPIPERFEPSDYHVKALAEAQKDLHALEAMTDDEIEEAAAAAHDKAISDYRSRLKEKHALRAKYESMLAKVRSFKPPSPDHVKYKEFMEEQIVSSIDFDCSTKYMEVPTDIPAKEWHAKKVAECSRSIVYHVEENRKEVERTESRNLWISQLRAALSENDG